MNAIKLILIIVAVFGVLAVAVTPVVADDRNWTGDEDTDWFDSRNWFEGFVPDSDDDVIIGQNYQVLIADEATAAECETLDIGLGSTLTIKGMALKLGDSDADTTSNIAGAPPAVPGTINMVEDSGAPGELVLYRWVTFEGGGDLKAKDAGPETGNGVVKRAGGANDKGIVIGDGSAVRFYGTINVMCDFDHEGTGFVGTDFSEDTMTFGPIFDDIEYREPYIKGDGLIWASSGKVVFSVVDFDATNAPDWGIAVGTIQLTSDADSSHYTGESFSISKAGNLPGPGTGTLDLDHSLATTGELRVNPWGSTGSMVIKVASDTVFSVGP